ncbi:MAG: FAD binding domain-containing protein [Ignavibacteriales bacterium]|nr:FAD binding domain-containing protein [Ignavibacteriales bacterium]
MVAPLKYYHPKSISELKTILGDLQVDNSRILAGGTDIVPDLFKNLDASDFNYKLN